MWADHQKSLGEVKIKCPLCREYFADYEVCTVIINMSV